VHPTGFSLTHNVATTAGGLSLAILQWLIQLNRNRAAPGPWLSFVALCGPVAALITFRDSTRRMHRLI